MRTLTTRTSGGGQYDFANGWHTVTIKAAKYGDWNGNKFLEMAFQDYPDTFTLRVYAKNSANGEEFAIGNVFRFANAGIEEVMNDGGADSKVLKINDAPDVLTGHQLNILFFKDGEYTRAYSSIAPTEFSNAAESFSTSDVDYWKGRAERRFSEYHDNVTLVDTKVHTNGTTKVTDSAKRQLEETPVPVPAGDDDLPF